MLFHLSFLVASIVTILSVDVLTYYQLQITKTRFVPVVPLYTSITMHAIAIIFHFCFAVYSESMIQNCFYFNNSNAIRWVYQFLTDGAGIVGLMLIHGFLHFETFLIVLLVFACTLVLCYYQDQYLNTNYDFAPELEPHLFAVPIYLLLICFIIIKSAETVSDTFSSRIVLVTIISLFQTSAMFLIQRLHIRLTKSDRNHLESLKSDEEEESKQNSAEYIDVELRMLSRGIMFEVLQYANSTFFQMTISWLIISITRTGSTLEPELSFHLTYDDRTNP